MATATQERPFTCSIISLTIEITDHRYSVDSIDPGESGTKAFRLTKHGKDRAVYDVLHDVYGLVACSCPDYLYRRESRTAEPCKHGRALVELGLMPAPVPPSPQPARHVPDEFDAPAPMPCCAPAEPLPCLGCATAAPDAVLSRGVALAMIESAIDQVDPDDAESDPELWDDSADNWFWAAGPDPTDRATAAREYLNPDDATLTLPELVDHQGRFYRSWPSSAGEMIARAMDELALKVRLTDASTPAEFAGRLEAHEAQVRDGWEAIGYREGLEAGRREQPGTAFGHQA